MLLGDSITEGFWWNNISGCLAINAGFGGARIHDLAGVVGSFASTTKPKHVHIMIGTNDLFVPASDPYLQTLDADLDTIVTAFTAQGSEVILWPIPPYAQSQSSVVPAGRREAINAAIFRVATARSVWWDWWWPNTITVGTVTGATVASGYAAAGSLNGDGVHLSAASQVSRFNRLVTWNTYIKQQTGTACN